MAEEISFKNLLATSGFFDGFQKSTSKGQAVWLWGFLSTSVLINEEDAHRDVLILMKTALQHVPTVSMLGGNSLELPQHCLKTTSTQSNGTWSLVAAPGNRL